MPITFVTVLRSGGVYSPLWVERLCRDALLHLKPERMVCLMDELHDPWFDWINPAPLIHNWPGWFSKLEVFRPGLFSGLCVYIDLDSILLRSIPDLEAKLTAALASCPLALLSDFYAPNRPATGVMAWMPCAQTERIYHEWAARPKIANGWQNGDGAHIGQFPHVRLQSILPGAFGSLKADKLHHGPKDFAIVCQHGKPKFNDLPPTHWMHRLWAGNVPNTEREPRA